ncbi:hypothetical protein B0J13DRAFT_544159 [Dactylonectria estremocensis]|uniref:Uncharacterized protein n=1 Tax=Dactylonectria estremocensis TaxID=1079267 RepID=A0A9P9F7I1_9HYPO|nr:hypothetical protein B0J13DRAFT_544159 [Dactylonectria estremocensis]
MPTATSKALDIYYAQYIFWYVLGMCVVIGISGIDCKTPPWPLFSPAHNPFDLNGDASAFRNPSAGVEWELEQEDGPSGVGYELRFEAPGRHDPCAAHISQMETPGVEQCQEAGPRKGSMGTDDSSKLDLGTVGLRTCILGHIGYFNPSQGRIGSLMDPIAVVRFTGR